MNLQMYILLVLAFVSANLPFLTTKFLLIFTVKKKNFGYHLIELIVYFVAVGVLAYFLEKSVSQVHTQGIAFFVITGCLYLVFAFPAFVWRYFWTSRNLA